MKKWHVNISTIAEADLDEIYGYIAETLLEPEVAWHQIERIYKAIFTLDEMPERCPLLLDEPWRSRGLRRLLVDNYIVIYEVQKDRNIVSVIAVLYCRRNIDALLQQCL